MYEDRAGTVGRVAIGAAIVCMARILLHGLSMQRCAAERALSQGIFVSTQRRPYV